MEQMKIVLSTDLPVGEDETKDRPCSILQFNKEGEITHKQDFNHNKIKHSDLALELLAQSLLPDIIEFFNSEEGRKFSEEHNKNKEN